MTEEKLNKDSFDIDSIKNLNNRILNSKLIKTILKFTYFDFRVVALAEEDNNIITGFLFLLSAGLQLVHMFLFYYYIAEMFIIDSILGIPIHGLFQYIMFFGSYFVVRKAIRKAAIGVPVALVSSALFAYAETVEIFEPVDLVWSIVAHSVVFVFLTSLHMSIYVDIPGYRKDLFAKNNKEYLEKIEFVQEEFVEICNKGASVESLLEKATTQFKEGECDLVLTRCRQSIEKSLKILYYKNQKKYPEDLYSAINGLKHLGINEINEDKISNLHQLRMKANDAVHNSNTKFSEWECVFAIEEAEVLYKIVKSKVGEINF